MDIYNRNKNLESSWIYHNNIVTLERRLKGDCVNSTRFKNLMYYVVWLCIQNIIKIPSINLPYQKNLSKEFETLSTSSKMAVLWHDNMYSQTVFQQLLGIVTKVVNFLWTYRCTYIITCWLPGGSGPSSSNVAGLDDNN